MGMHCMWACGEFYRHGPARANEPTSQRADATHTDTRTRHNNRGASYACHPPTWYLALYTTPKDPTPIFLSRRRYLIGMVCHDSGSLALKLPALPPVRWCGWSACALVRLPSSSRGTPNSPPSSLPPICPCICAHVCGIAQSKQGQVFIAPPDATHATHATNLRGEVVQLTGLHQTWTRTAG